MHNVNAENSLVLAACPIRGGQCRLLFRLYDRLCVTSQEICHYNMHETALNEKSQGAKGNRKIVIL